LIERFRQLPIPWFEANARLGFCQVRVREEKCGVSFVIRHGDMLKRIGVYEEDGTPGSRILRPERLDLAHYRQHTGEWQISGLGAKLQELYRQAFGAIFHGSPNALVHAKRYSLEPLREGPSSLVCDPNSRVQFAQLKSLKLELETGHQLVITQGNVFSGILALNPSLWQTAAFLEARIDLKIAHRRSLVQVTLNPRSDKVSGIHLDDAIESWLIERHFAHNSHESFAVESA
jgi:hypothetical protein